MKVLHVEMGRHLYGGALQVRYLVEGLARRGIECHLAAPSGSAIGEALCDVAKVHPLSCGGEADLRLLFALRGILRREKIDLLHAHSRRGADHWGLLAARSAGCRALVTRRVDNPEPPWLARLKYGRFDRVAAISEGIRRVLLRQGVDPAQVETIHSAVDTQRYRPGGDRTLLRCEFGWPESTPVIGVIAQLIERKGHRYLLEAAPEILERHPELKIVFFGQGPLRESLASEIRNAGLDGAVVLAGFRNDMEQILPTLDLVVHPALMEGLGVSLLQAAACGIAVVGAASGGIPEIVKDGVNGYLVPPGQSQALVQPIRRLLENPALLHELGAAGRAHVVENFSIDAMVTRNLELYHRLLGTERA